MMIIHHDYYQQEELSNEELVIFAPRFVMTRRSLYKYQVQQERECGNLGYYH